MGVAVDTFLTPFYFIGAFSADESLNSQRWSCGLRYDVGLN